MNDVSIKKVHWSFWLIGALALLWNIGGAINYIMQMNSGVVSSMPETHQAIIVGRPVWATAGFAICVFGGAIGCLLLLFKRSEAMYLFIASLLGVIVTMIHTFRVIGSEVTFSMGEIVVMAILPVIVAGLLIAYTKFAINKDWLK